MKRCGKCANCVDLARVQRLVLACANPIRNGVYPSTVHADQGVVDLWNAELKRLVCLTPQPAEVTSP